MQDEFNDHLSERLRSERMRLDIPQMAFAEACNVSRGALLKWEKGESTPNASALAVMAGLGVDVLYVVTGARSGESESTLSPAERDLLTAWRVAPAKVRTALDAIAALTKND